MCRKAAWKMRDGPSGSAYRSRSQTTPSCCDVAVVSVGAKARGTTLSRCASERRTKVNPSKTRREVAWRRQNQRRDAPLGQVCRVPGDWADGDRRKGGVSRMQAYTRNCRNQCSDVKGEAQAAKTARREYRCGVLGRTDPY